MLKGINQWGFPEGTSLDELFHHAKLAGYDAVELNLNPFGGIGLTMESTPDEAEAILALATKHGIKLRSLSTSLLWRAPLSATDPAVRAEGAAIVTKQIELASLLGLDTILVVPGVVNADNPYDECYNQSQDEIRKLLPIAEQHGVYIGIENVWNKFLLSPLEMNRYIDELDSPMAAVYFDVGNILQYGYPEQWIRILGHRIKKVHVKDFNTNIGNGAGFVPLLSGNVNWREVRRALHEISYNDTLTAELSPYAADPFQMAYDTSRQLDIIIGSPNPPQE
ncbi:hexulose-6-phosphate isomerase [Paenibacillus uliginis N3/975]|uniref:Hexulose-6-phosphate isomerase n=1 Tax=Paenibacillus uliginis N3/975 TaxID=1313296 RepID=A0A1X7H8D4_9BACL|nr:sugar phosphate isomerase/epimerase family protein [Paenibacillus uliginis]SMF80951.1 hexulose-6-phosphate isomerase [Paenibacillus uliginis N3/975]